MENGIERMSYPERKVADFLKKMNIEWIYEKPVFVWDDDGRPRVWAPDFYLNQFGVFIEVCGSSDFNYDYRKRIFTQNGYCVIFLHVFKRTEKWECYFEKCLYHFISQKNKAFSFFQSRNIKIS